MGITYDQIANGALRRLEFHYKNLVSHKRRDAEPVGEALARFDAEALAFAYTATDSEHLVGLMRDVTTALERDTTLEAMAAELEEDWHSPDPRLGLRVLELVMRGYALLEKNRRCDQGSDLDGGYHAMGVLEGWGDKYKWLRDTLLYLTQEQFVAWGGKGMPEYAWLGYRNSLARNEKWRLP